MNLRKRSSVNVLGTIALAVMFSSNPVQAEHAPFIVYDHDEFGNVMTGVVLDDVPHPDTPVEMYDYHQPTEYQYHTEEAPTGVSDPFYPDMFVPVDTMPDYGYFFTDSLELLTALEESLESSNSLGEAADTITSFIHLPDLVMITTTLDPDPHTTVQACSLAPDLCGEFSVYDNLPGILDVATVVDNPNLQMCQFAFGNSPTSSADMPIGTEPDSQFVSYEEAAEPEKKKLDPWTETIGLLTYRNLTISGYYIFEDSGTKAALQDAAKKLWLGAKQLTDLQRKANFNREAETALQRVFTWAESERDKESVQESRKVGIPLKKGSAKIIDTIDVRSRRGSIKIGEVTYKVKVSWGVGEIDNERFILLDVLPYNTDRSPKYGGNFTIADLKDSMPGEPNGPLDKLFTDTIRPAIGDVQVNLPVHGLSYLISTSSAANADNVKILSIYHQYEQASTWDDFVVTLEKAFVEKKIEGVTLESVAKQIKDLWFVSNSILDRSMTDSIAVFFSSNYSENLGRYTIEPVIKGKMSDIWDCNAIFLELTVRRFVKE